MGIVQLVQPAQAHQESAHGRHRILLNNLADQHKKLIEQRHDSVAGRLIFEAYQVIVEQEIELRQAIADKCARPMVETL